ncbi:MAG TPA: alternative ribosome rescue aminoacyl-tRNA hydrolase ArfB [Acidimicrobiales bacterium]|nr:alternative ribosome rescue aminoacyl-tRNA hydrolase ArfB [Acidimicrobiales bacterium]
MTDPGDDGGDGRLSRPGTLTIAPGIAIPERELAWRFSASGGPGGQHVNTSNTRAEVTFDVAGSPNLPDWARERLMSRLGPVVSVAASDRRSQTRNRELALARLAARLQSALDVAPPRRPTRPSLATQRRRIEAKRRRGQLKRDRRSGGAGGVAEE